MQTLMGLVLLVQRQAPLATEVMQAEYIQVGIQCLGRQVKPMKSQ